jgi:hypothetical protein
MALCQAHGLECGSTTAMLSRLCEKLEAAMATGDWPSFTQPPDASGSAVPDAYRIGCRTAGPTGHCGAFGAASSAFEPECGGQQRACWQAELAHRGARLEGRGPHCYSTDFGTVMPTLGHTEPLGLWVKCILTTQSTCSSLTRRPPPNSSRKHRDGKSATENLDSAPQRLSKSGPRNRTR